MTIRVLVVEDDPDLSDIYRAWLSDTYDVETAKDGATALERLDESVDVVLLDRRMPDITGDEVLATLKERGLDCRVAMVTAVEPDFDVLEMGFDDYLIKPVTAADLRDVIERLDTRSTYDSQVQEYFSLVSKQALLEAEKRPEELADNEEYATLQTRIEELREEIDVTIDDFDDEDFGRAFTDI